MKLKEKLENLITLNEEELQKIINERFLELEFKVVKPNEKHIRPAISPVIYRNYINSTQSDVQITGGFDDVLFYYVDNTREIFENFINKLKQEQPNSLEDIFKSVSQTIFEYIGDIGVSGDLSNRLSHFQDDDKSKLSSFKGTRNAWCMERSVMAHQIFTMLGLESELVISPIWLDEKLRKDNSIKTEMHAFNMIRYNGRTFLFDSTLIDYSKPIEEQNSIVEILPETAFDTLNGISKRCFSSREGNIRSCVYNPKNMQPCIFGETQQETEHINI